MYMKNIEYTLFVIAIAFFLPNNFVTANQLPIGYFDAIVYGEIAGGWTYDPDHPTQSISVSFYINGPEGTGTYAGSVSTDGLRSDVNQAYGITGNHAFGFRIPDSFRDGKQ